MPAATMTAPVSDQFAGRTRAELVAMCRLRKLRVVRGDNAAALRRRLREDLALRRADDAGRFVKPPLADRDTAARMALIDGEVCAHFAVSPKPISTRAIAHALRRNQQEVLLAMQRLDCPRRLSNGLYGPPPTTKETT